MYQTYHFLASAFSYFFRFLFCLDLSAGKLFCVIRRYNHDWTVRILHLAGVSMGYKSMESFFLLLFNRDCICFSADCWAPFNMRYEKDYLQIFISLSILSLGLSIALFCYRFFWSSSNFRQFVFGTCVQ